MNTDWVGLIDEWAARFFQELDYEREARNAAVFRDQMADLGGITVAEVYGNLTSREVLTTAWVQGGLPRNSPVQKTFSCRLVRGDCHGFLHGG